MNSESVHVDYGVSHGRQFTPEAVDSGPDLVWSCPEHEPDSLVFPDEVDHDLGLVHVPGAIPDPDAEEEVAFHVLLRNKVYGYGSGFGVDQECRRWNVGNGF